MFAASKTASVSGGYQISRSLRFNSDDFAYLNRTPASATNRKTWTYSAWVKRSKLSAIQVNLFEAWVNSTNQLEIGFDANEVFRIYNVVSSAYTLHMVSSAVYRDPSAWYHVVVAVDTTQATDTNRIKIYINGSQLTAFGTATYPAQNSDTWVNSANAHNIGRNQDYATYYGGYQTEVNFIDGQALTPSSFGETNADTGVWQPKAYSGTYGTNGFYLNFSDNSNTTAATLGKDYSGNGNNWTPNNFSVTAGAGNDSLVDSPTSYGTDTGVGGTVRGNYCTLNPLYKNGAGTPAITNGNLDMLAGGTGDSYFGGTFSISSGKWYYECLVNSVASSGGTGLLIGICKTSAPNGVNVGAYRNTSEIYNLDGTTQTAGATYATGDLIGVAFDIDAGTVQFYKNGTAQGATPSFTFTAGTEVFVRGRSDGANPSVTFNFGQRPFAYTAPSGYKALCTQNLPTPTIGATSATLAGKYFNPVLYTGNSSTNAITGVGFQPDLTWFKRRDAAYANVLQNSATGVTKYLVSNTTDAEGTYSGYIQSWNSDGFTLGSGDNASNNSGSTYVAWNWKANGSGSTNTVGSITSTVSVNTTSGFSIVTFTGTNANATVGHGLGVAPAMVIMKNRAALDSWQVYHSSLPSAAYRLQLNSSAAADSQPTVWNSTAPTSTVFSVGTNVGNYTQIAYCFAPVSGYSSFGSWTGNGSSTGPFIYTGFRPALVLVKNTTSAGPQWWILDNKRNTYNPEDLALPPSLAYAEQTIPTCLNFLSNGFQITTTNGDFNTNGSNYIYMAIAETPLKFSLAR